MLQPHHPARACMSNPRGERAEKRNGDYAFSSTNFLTSFEEMQVHLGQLLPELNSASESKVSTLLFAIPSFQRASPAPISVKFPVSLS